MLLDGCLKIGCRFRSQPDIHCLAVFFVGPFVVRAVPLFGVGSASAFGFSTLDQRASTVPLEKYPSFDKVAFISWKRFESVAIWVRSLEERVVAIGILVLR